MLKRPISAPRASATGPIGVYWPLSWRRTCGGLTRPDQTVSSEPTNSAPTIDSANAPRSEEHTSELQSLMRISYAVFCLKKKKQNITTNNKKNTKRQQ